MVIFVNNTSWTGVYHWNPQINHGFPLLHELLLQCTIFQSNKAPGWNHNLSSQWRLPCIGGRPANWSPSVQHKYGVRPDKGLRGQDQVNLASPVKAVRPVKPKRPTIECQKQLRAKFVKKHAAQRAHNNYAALNIWSTPVWKADNPNILQIKGSNAPGRKVQ